jgi:cell division protein ZapE
MGLREIYQTRISDQGLKSDSGQARVVDELDNLAVRLQGQQGGFLKKLFGRAEAARGLYIHGDVGRGKTMLMDLFFDTVQMPKKRRVHFHGFMQDVHRRRTHANSDDVIGTVADQLAADATLLCLDEMQIVDIADAMIIGRLYEALLHRGVTLVTTSNLPPEGLYKDGLNRDLFLPFIVMLNDTMDVVSLSSARDYRLGRVRARETYLCPATAENRVAFNALWNDLTDEAAGRPETLEILGRKLIVPKAARGCAAFTFNELCGQPLGPPDYLAIAKAYRTVFMSGLSRFQEQHRNETKRFIVMIDTFYDAGTRLVALAEAQPEDLAPPGQHGFEFQRTVSRLKEMQAASWWIDNRLET